MFTSCPSVEFFVIPPLIKSLSILCSSLIPYSYLIKLNHLWSEFISSTVRFVQLRNYIYFLKYFESNKKKKKTAMITKRLIRKIVVFLSVDEVFFQMSRHLAAFNFIYGADFLVLFFDVSSCTRPLAYVFPFNYAYEYDMCSTASITLNSSSRFYRFLLICLMLLSYFVRISIVRVRFRLIR